MNLLKRKNKVSQAEKKKLINKYKVLEVVWYWAVNDSIIWQEKTLRRKSSQAFLMNNGVTVFKIL